MGASSRTLLSDALATASEVVAVSALAEGADTLFARDHLRDLVSGGFGYDRASVDGQDRVVGVEKTTRG